MSTAFVVLMALSIAILAATIAGAWAFHSWMSRVHPLKKPDPSGAELLQALEEHKKEVQKSLENLSGKLELRQQRLGMRE